MSEWKSCKIGDLVTLRQGFAINSKSKHYISKDPTSLALLRIADMKSGAKEIFIKEDIPQNFIAKPEDIIYTRTGNVGLVFKNCYGVVHNNCFTVTPNDENELTRDFLFYLLQSKTFFDKANSLARGAAQPDLPHTLFNSIEISYPPLPIQHRIATILSRYDTLIENYQKQIKLLEEVAQRLYKEWFVDLRFPGYENVKMVDGLPEGWERKKVGEVVTKSIGGGWGKETPQEQYDREGFVIRGTDISKLKNGSLNEIPFRYHTESNLKERTLSDGDIIFEVSGGSEKEPVGRMYLITQPILDYYCKDVICASFCKKISFANKMISVLCYFAMQHCRNTGDMKKFEKDSAGNIINFAWTTFLEDFNVLLPNNEVLNAFYRRANAIINSEVKLSLQICLLTEARDRLLPRLMGGEIKMKV